MKENRTAERTNTGLKRSNLFTPNASPSPLLRKNQILSKEWPRISPRHFAHSSFDGTHLILEPEYQQVPSIPLVFSASASWISQIERFFAKITDDGSRSVYFAEKSPFATLGTRTRLAAGATRQNRTRQSRLHRQRAWLPPPSPPLCVQGLIDSLAGLTVDPSQFARRQRRYVRQNIFNNSLNLRSEILATKTDLFVIEAQYH